MDLVKLINHPELLDRDTLFELRSILALYPYYQPARLLMLQNLFLLHDPSFDSELRRAAIYITDRKTLFNMVEAAHYQIAPKHRETETKQPSEDRTTDLIDTFLETVPPEEEEESKDKTVKRKPSPADATVDYVAYLLQCEADIQSAKEQTPEMKGQSLIDNFLEHEQGRIMLNESLENSTQEREEEEEKYANGQEGNEEEYFTETLARIYIKQGRYQKALDIITRLSNKYPQKNAYFADQIRFLQKLVINSNKNKN